MPQNELIPTSWSILAESSSTSPQYQLDLHSKPSSTCPLETHFSLTALSPTLFRITFTSPSHTLPPYPSCQPPVPVPVHYTTLSASASHRSLALPGGLQLAINWSETPLVTITRPAGVAAADSNRSSDDSRNPHTTATAPLYTDLPHRSYCLDGPGTSHYTAYNRASLHMGLGEKAAPFDLSGRTFRVAATDSFGYDGHRTDPLYKHVPFVVEARSPAQGGGCVGVFETSLARGMVSLGGEMDGCWGRYKVWRQEYGGLETYIAVGADMADVVRQYGDLVGKPLRVPRWAMGYLAGGYKYAMLEDASVFLSAFANKMVKEDIPCSGFQLSSGYQFSESEPQVRNPFTWNKKRFPDHRGWLKEFRKAGIRVIANIKPYVLKEHPDYEELKRNNALFTNPRTGSNAVARLWSAGGGESGEGGYLDFSSAYAFRWWYNGVRGLIQDGVTGIWNDNNEYSIPEDSWQCKLDYISSGPNSSRTRALDFHDRSVGLWGRAMHTELMAKASYLACKDEKPGEIPYVLTRSATPGTMKYAASSWSGDNVTSWASMKANNAMALNAGVSLITCYGHDIGGFEGPQPTPELLIRWVQLGIYSPRFAINCFKTSANDSKVGEVIEPWMYPAVTHLVRAAIKRRYELLPYIYSLILEAHQFSIPPLRWVGWHSSSSSSSSAAAADPQVWASEDLRAGEKQYWFGPSLMVAGVYEPDQKVARLYLPRTSTSTGAGDGPDLPELGFIRLDSEMTFPHYPSGQWVEAPAHWKSGIAVFAKCGSAIPIGRAEQTLAWGEVVAAAADESSDSDLGEGNRLARDDWRGVEIYPPPGDQGDRLFGSAWYEDDGVNENSKIHAFTLTYRCYQKSIVVSYHDTCSADNRPLWQELHILVPPSEERSICNEHGELFENMGVSEKGLVHYVLPLH